MLDLASGSQGGVSSLCAVGDGVCRNANNIANTTAQMGIAFWATHIDKNPGPGDKHQIISR